MFFAGSLKKLNEFDGACSSVESQFIPSGKSSIQPVDLANGWTPTNMSAAAGLIIINKSGRDGIIHQQILVGHHRVTMSLASQNNVFEH